MTVSLGHVECRHAHYPATPPVYRSEKIVNPVSAASGLLDFSSQALKHLHLAFDLEYPEESKTSKKFKTGRQLKSDWHAGVLRGLGCGRQRLNVTSPANFAILRTYICEM